MACCGEGNPIPYEELFPDELKALRKNLVNYTGKNVGLGATPYPGNVAAPVNPASNAALNMVMGMMGHGGYTAPQGVPSPFGQQGTPIIWDEDRDEPPPDDPPPGGADLPPGADGRKRRYDRYDRSTWY